MLFASGTPAVLIEPQPWFRGKDAADIQAAIAATAPTPAPAAAGSSWQVGPLS